MKRPEFGGSRRVKTYRLMRVVRLCMLLFAAIAAASTCSKEIGRGRCRGAVLWMALVT